VAYLGTLQVVVVVDLRGCQPSGPCFGLVVDCSSGFDIGRCLDPDLGLDSCPATAGCCTDFVLGLGLGLEAGSPSGLGFLAARVRPAMNKDLLVSEAAWRRESSWGSHGVASARSAG